MCSGLSEQCEDEALYRGIEKEEIVKCIKNNRTDGGDGLVGELLK